MGEWPSHDARAGPSQPRPRTAARVLTVMACASPLTPIGIERRPWQALARPRRRRRVGIIDGHHRRLGPAHPPGGDRRTELDQTSATRKDGSGPAALPSRAKLRRRISGQDLRCERRPRPLPARARDLLLRDGSDLNAWMVRQGWALAFRLDHALPRRAARGRVVRARIWAGSFMPPWDGATRR